MVVSMLKTRSALRFWSNIYAGTFCKYRVTWKALTISAKSYISNDWLGSKYASGISKVTLHKCTRNGKHLCRNSEYAKIVLVKQFEQLFWNVPKKAVRRLQGDMRGVDHSYPGAQLAAWNVTMEDIFIKCIFLRPIWNYSQLLFYPWDGCDHVYSW